uniref:Small nuclear ribonucleoprotein G n=1 Tax=Neogobius melanostomus TaxID=47308 RepID=A0A8C6WIB7_9GOBI
MSKAHPPELKKFMDKKLSLKLNGGRHVQGILRGFDPFMNLVVDESLEMGPGGQQNSIGMVVRLIHWPFHPPLLSGLMSVSELQSLLVRN